MMILQHKNGYVVKLQKLPAGSPPGLDTSHLDTLNKLLEFGHKGQSAIVFDDQVILILILISGAFFGRIGKHLNAIYMLLSSCANIDIMAVLHSKSVVCGKKIVIKVQYLEQTLFQMEIVFVCLIIICAVLCLCWVHHSESIKLLLF